jgi:hypothetical protein
MHTVRALLSRGQWVGRISAMPHGEYRIHRCPSDYPPRAPRGRS